MGTSTSSSKMDVQRSYKRGCNVKALSRFFPRSTAWSFLRNLFFNIAAKRFSAVGRCGAAAGQGMKAMLCCVSDIRNPTCVSARTLESQRKVSDLDTKHSRSIFVGAAELVPNSCCFVSHHCDGGWPLLNGDGIRVDVGPNAQIVAMEAVVANTVK